MFFDDAADDLIPMSWLGAGLPLATATAKVSDGEVGEHGQPDLLTEVLARPMQTLVTSTDKVVAFDQGVSADACGEAAHFEIGDEAAHGAACDATDDAPNGFRHLLWGVKLLVGQFPERSCRLAFEAMELDDESLRRAQMLEQLNELADREPAEIAGILRRWMRTTA